MAVAERLRQRRDAAGALELSSAELRFETQKGKEKEKGAPPRSDGKAGGTDKGIGGGREGEEEGGDEAGLPACVRTKEELPVNGLIAEFMIWVSARTQACGGRARGSPWSFR